MATVDNLRNSIINKLLTISNEEYLVAINKLLEGNPVRTEEVTLTEEQNLMLKMSEDDIFNGRLISQSELDKKDLEWLKNL